MVLYFLSIYPALFILLNINSDLLKEGSCLMALDRIIQADALINRCI